MFRTLLFFVALFGLDALKKSPNGGNGFFIQLQEYSPEIYGLFPFAVDHEHLPANLLASHVKSVQQEQEYAPDFLGLSERTRKYRQRVQFMEFMAQNVLRDFQLTNDAEVMWIQPLIYVKNSAKFDFTAFVKHPHVKKVIENDIVGEVAMFGEIPSREESGVSIGSESVSVQGSTITAWGIEKVGADRAWAKTRGEGVRIGIIDTGVNYLHHALNASYAGKISSDKYVHDYVWFDPKEFRYL